MARYYIDVDKAYDALNEKTKGKPPEYCGIAEEFIQAVDNLPTADVVPRAYYDAVIAAQESLQRHIAKLKDEISKLKIKKSELQEMKQEIPIEPTSVQNQIVGPRKDIIRYYSHDSIGTKIVMSLPKDFIESYEAALIIKIVDILRGSKKWEVKE